jgi:hypothetical protein
MGRTIQTIEAFSTHERVLIVLEAQRAVLALEQQLEQAREATKAAQQDNEATEARLEGLWNQDQELLEQQRTKAPNKEDLSSFEELQTKNKSLEEDKKLAEEERHVLRKQLEDSRSESWSDKRRMMENIFVLKNVISEPRGQTRGSRGRSARRIH